MVSNAAAPPRSPAHAQLLDHQLCFAVYSTMLSLNKLYRGLLKDLEITYPQYLVMMVVWEADGMTVSQIGSRLFLDYPTLTPLLKRLEGQGLLLRQRSLLDERHVHIWLTDNGRALQRRARHVPGCVAAAMSCSTESIASLRDELVELRTAVLHSTDGN